MDPGTVLQALNVLDDEAAIDVIGQALTTRPHIAPRVVAGACPDLTYAPARALTERRSNGVVKMVSRDGNYGFISCPELQVVFGCDVFVSHKQLGWYAKGQTVSFAVLLNREQKPQAFDLAEGSTMTDGKGNTVPVSGGGKGDHHGGGGNSWGMSPCGGTKGKPNLPPIHDAGKGGGLGKNSSRVPGPGDVPLGEHLGVLRSINPEKGYGFIVCETLKGQVEGDVYVHGSQTVGFHVGSEIRFEAYLHNSRPQGRNLKDATGMLSREAVQAAMQAVGGETAAVQAVGGGGGGQPQELGQFVGKVKMYHHEKAYGFVQCEELANQGYPGDCFVSMKNTPGGVLNVGDDVSLTVSVVNGRLQGRDPQVIGTAGHLPSLSNEWSDYGGTDGGGNLAADWNATGPAGGGVGLSGGMQMGGAPPPQQQVAGVGGTVGGAAPAMGGGGFAPMAQTGCGGAPPGAAEFGTQGMMDPNADAKRQRLL